MQATNTTNFGITTATVHDIETHYGLLTAEAARSPFLLFRGIKNSDVEPITAEDAAEFMKMGPKWSRRVVRRAAFMVTTHYGHESQTQYMSMSWVPVDSEVSA